MADSMMAVMLSSTEKIGAVAMAICQIMMNRLMGTILLKKTLSSVLLGYLKGVCMYVRVSEQIEGCLCSP